MDMVHALLEQWSLRRRRKRQLEEEQKDGVEEEDGVEDEEGEEEDGVAEDGDKNEKRMVDGNVMKL